MRLKSLQAGGGGGADRKGRVLVVETQTTTEDLLKGGTLAAEAGESAFAVSEEEHVAETAGNGLVYRFVKRAFDIAFSLCVVVVGLAPIALLLLIIRLESPGFADIPPRAHRLSRPTVTHLQAAHHGGRLRRCREASEP